MIDVSDWSDEDVMTLATLLALSIGPSEAEEAFRLRVEYHTAKWEEALRPVFEWLGEAT